MGRIALAGLLLWIAGTVLIRVAGDGLLSGDPARIVALYAISFVAMALIVPRICRRFAPKDHSAIEAATVLILPTLLLDPFSCVFFTRVFPNITPVAAGAFGGWMLICCGGAVAGVWARR